MSAQRPPRARRADPPGLARGRSRPPCIRVAPQENVTAGAVEVRGLLDSPLFIDIPPITPEIQSLMTQTQALYAVINSTRLGPSCATAYPALADRWQCLFGQVWRRPPLALPPVQPLSTKRPPRHPPLFDRRPPCPASTACRCWPRRTCSTPRSSTNSTCPTTSAAPPSLATSWMSGSRPCLRTQTRSRPPTWGCWPACRRKRRTRARCSAPAASSTASPTALRSGTCTSTLCRALG